MKEEKTTSILAFLYTKLHLMEIGKQQESSLINDQSWYDIASPTILTLHFTLQQHTKFVEALVELMDAKDLELQNIHGNTAICLAASAGNVEMIRTMVHWNKRLPTIPGAQGMMPLYMAALVGNHDSVNYLYDDSDKMTGDFWMHRNWVWVLIKCIEADLFGEYFRR